MNKNCIEFENLKDKCGDEKNKTQYIICYMILFQYGTKRSGDKSGAYLFMPDGEATVLEARSPLVRIVEGKVLSYVEVHTPWGKHTVSLLGSPGKIELCFS